jgi:tetratricopeptide (TPR) repeat protein
VREIMTFEEAMQHRKSGIGSWYGARERLFDEAWPVVRPTFNLARGATIFTIGSCFARNIEEHVHRLGYRVPTLDFAVPKEEWRGPRPNGILNKYTPPSIYQEIAWVRTIMERDGQVTEEDCKPHMFPVSGGRCIDLGLCGFLPVTRERFLERRRQMYDVARKVFESDCVVITLGLIEAWFDTETGLYIQETPVSREFDGRQGRFRFERLGYAESVGFVQRALDSIREVNPRALFLITTSPVPLARTFTKDDVITANMYSKSLLRTVAGSICANNPGVDYFPSYENVMLTRRWDIWEDDLSHVRDAFVAKIVLRLTETYFSSAAEARRTVLQSYVESTSGDLTRAIALAREACEYAPDDVDSAVHLASLLTKSGELAEAEAILRKCRDKGGVAALRVLSQVLAARGKTDEAIEVARVAVRARPDDEDLRRHLASLLEKGPLSSNRASV